MNSGVLRNRIVTPTPTIFIGEGIGDKTRYEITKALADVETNGIPVIVDTIFKVFHSYNKEKYDPKKELYYLLFDHNSLLLYHKSSISQPCIHCILNHIKRNYNPRKWKTLAKYYGAEPYEFSSGISGISIVWQILKELRGEDLFLYLDCLSMELRKEPALYSGNCGCAMSTHKATTSFLKDHVVGETLRIDRSITAPNFISSYSGVVAKQSLFYDTSSLPTGIARVGYGIKELDDVCGGRAFSEEAAKKVATYESIERLHLRVLSPEEERIESSYQTIREDAIDPKDLMFNKVTPSEESSQYSPMLRMQWTKCSHMLNNDQKWVPSQAVWIAREMLSDDTLCIANTSNGCALGGSLEEAILYGLFELIERDNFLLAWYCRRPCRQIDPLSVEHERFRLLYEKICYFHPNYEIYFLDTTTDSGIPSVWALAVRKYGSGPKTISSSSARLDVEKAMFSALTELTGFFVRKTSFKREANAYRILIEKPELVNEINQHSSLYGLDEVFYRLRFLDLNGVDRVPAEAVNQAGLIPQQTTYALRTVLEKIAEHLQTLGCEFYYKDMTLAGFERYQIHCARAIITNFYPIYFGYHEKRFERTKRLDNLWESIYARPLSSLEEINFEIHPFG